MRLFQIIARDVDTVRNASSWQWGALSRERIARFVLEHFPAGTSFDVQTHLDNPREHLIFEIGDHEVIVTPSFDGINLRVRGPAAEGLREHLHAQFAEILMIQLPYTI